MMEERFVWRSSFQMERYLVLTEWAFFDIDPYLVLRDVDMSFTQIKLSL
jgi:hypothetical protein